MLKARVRIKTDTSAAWRLNNPILLKGEEGYESDTGLSKIGDGVHDWLELDYKNAGAAAISSTANYALNSSALGGISYSDWAAKFDEYVLKNQIESTMSKDSLPEMIPTSLAVIQWVKDQNFAGSGDITEWEEF